MIPSPPDHGPGLAPPAEDASSPRARVIAVLGAESTGKTRLCEELALRFASLPGWTAEQVGCVGETLRAFCDREGRTPRPDEQTGIAREHSRRIEWAAQRHRVVIADTSAVMTAVYSLFVFGDRSLHGDALEAHRQGVDVTLVTALDLPWVADGHQRDGPHVREPVDRLLRAALREGGIEHAIVAGVEGARLEAAWRALAPHRRAWGWPAGGAEVGMPPEAEPADPGAVGAQPRRSPRWRAMCECCADPAAERADFSLRRPRPRPR